MRSFVLLSVPRASSQGFALRMRSPLAERRPSRLVFQHGKLIAHRNIFNLLVYRRQFIVRTKIAQEYAKTMLWY